VTEGVARATPSFFLNPSHHLIAVSVSVGTACVSGVRNSVEFTEKNIRTDLDAMQEMVEINSQSTPTTVIDGEVIISFDKQKISALLGL
jgi:hypothetical protein